MKDFLLLGYLPFAKHHSDCAFCEIWSLFQRILFMTVLFASLVRR
jgi:hypothetical protein